MTPAQTAQSAQPATAQSAQPATAQSAIPIMADVLKFRQRATDGFIKISELNITVLNAPICNRARYTFKEWLKRPSTARIINKAMALGKIRNIKVIDLVAGNIINNCGTWVDNS